MHPSAHGRATKHPHESGGVGVDPGPQLGQISTGLTASPLPRASAAIAGRPPTVDARSPVSYTHLRAHETSAHL
eukprot:11185459-Alexandrium_andersonii.AAC.1